MLATWMRLIVGLVGLASVVVSGLWCGFLYMGRVDQLNALLPESERFGVLGWYSEKYSRFEREYARVFPGSKARAREFKFFAIFAAGALLMAAAMFL
jgi:hypothetical protein